MQQSSGVVQFHVSVKVDMTELTGWSADCINSFFAGIAKVLATQASVVYVVSTPPPRVPDESQAPPTQAVGAASVGSGEGGVG